MLLFIEAVLAAGAMIVGLGFFFSRRNWVEAAAGLGVTVLGLGAWLHALSRL